MNFISVLGINFQIANSRTKWHCNFIVLLQDGGHVDVSKNLPSLSL